MRADEAEIAGLGHQVGVEPEHHVRVAARSLETQPRQQDRGVIDRRPANGARAVGLEGLLDLRSRAPLADKRLIGVDIKRLGAR